MLSSQSQFARACRALCTAAAMCLLPQGAAWADEYNLTLDPPEGFIIRDVPLLVTATVTPAPPQGYVEFVVGDLNSNPDVRRPLLDNKGRACTQINQADLDKYWSDTWGWNYVWAEYGYDQGAEFAGQMVRYYYDPTRARAKSPRVGANSALEPGQHLTMTALTPIPPNLVAGQDVYVTLSAQVLDCNDASIYPQGNVDFCNTTNDHRLGAVNVWKGFANLTLPAAVWLSVGDNIVTAKFTPANASWGMSTDQATVRVQPPPQAKAKDKAKTVSRPYINCSGSIVGEKPIRRGMRPQAPPGKGTR